MASKRKIFTCTDETQEKLNKIKKHIGSESESAAISFAIAEAYRSIFPPHTRLNELK